MQCGADSLNGDPVDLNSPFNLTVEGYCKCVQLVIGKYKFWLVSLVLIKLKKKRI